MSFYNEIMSILRMAIEERAKGNVLEFSRQVKIRQTTIYGWLNYQGRSPNLNDIGTIMDYLGVKVINPYNQANSSIPIIDPAHDKLIAELTAKISKLKEELTFTEGQLAGIKQIVLT